MMRRVVVIGASAGGIDPLRRLLSALPAGFGATILVTVHVPARSHSAMPQVLGRHAALPVEHATDGAELAAGRVLVAPPDHHLLVDGDRVRLARSPRENGHRPAIDPMFRSAARWWGRGVVGVILSGALDDGTAGLRAVHLRGGTTLIQDPDQAEYPGMPQSARAHVPEARTLAIDDLAPALLALVAEDLPEDPMPITRSDEPLRPEDKTAETAPERDANEDREGNPSGFTCPDCHGALWQVVDGQLIRYRCRVGHAFAPASLVAFQEEGVEEALWAAYRALEESASMSNRLADRMREQGFPAAAEQYARKREGALGRARLIFRALEAEANGEIARGRLRSS